MVSDDEPPPPPLSRIERNAPRGFRVLTRTRDRNRFRERFTRQRKQRPIGELFGMVIREHRLTDEVRQRIVGLYWQEIAGERIACKTFPGSIIEGVLHVSAFHSSWVHEMQRRTQLVDPEYARTLRERHLLRTRPKRDLVAPTNVTDAERAAIRVDTCAIIDDDLRALIERVRLKWNR